MNFSSSLKKLPLLLTCTSLPSILSAPAPETRVLPYGKRSLDPLAVVQEFTPYITTPSSTTPNLKERSAGLFWGPHEVSNLKFYITNPEEGYAGPKFPWANHINVHVDKKGPPPKELYKQVVNMHVVKYSSGENSNCLYSWDSVTKTVVFDSCFDDFTDAIGECVDAIKSTVDALLENADTIAKIVIIGALVAALVAVISSLGVVALA